MSSPKRRRSRSASRANPSQPGARLVIAALTARVEQLEQAFNTNTKVFSDGIQMLEAQQEVLRRVAQDLFAQLGGHGGGRVPLAGKVSCTAEGAVDFNAYLKAYIGELEEAEEKAEAGAAAPPLVVSPDEDSPIIFGGDASP